jgi:hypothetical protein
MSKGIGMNIKTLTVIIASFISLNVFAGERNESAETIPFVTYKSHIIYYSTPVTASSILPPASANHPSASMQDSLKIDMNSSAMVSAVEQESSTSNIPTADVQNLITRVRNAVCNSVGDSDVRVWVSIDASGKLLGVGASTQSGLEVTFHCKGKISQKNIRG